MVASPFESSYLIELIIERLFSFPFFSALCRLMITWSETPNGVGLLSTDDDNNNDTWVAHLLQKRQQ